MPGRTAMIAPDSPQDPNAEPLQSEETLLDTAAESEHQVLGLLSKKRLSSRVLERIARENPFRDRLKVQTALARHPAAPLHVALPQLKHISSLSLVSMLKDPRLSAVIRKKVEAILLEQLLKLPLGTKKAIARLGRGELLVRLLEEKTEEIVLICLSNPYLTEGDLSKAVFRTTTSTTAVRILSSHPKWSLRYSLRLALLRNAHAPLSECLSFVPNLKLPDLKLAAEDTRVHPSLRIHLSDTLRKRQKHLTGLKPDVEEPHDAEDKDETAPGPNPDDPNR